MIPTLPEANLEGGQRKEENKGYNEVGDKYWLGLASSAYTSSTTFIDANYRRQWERNISNFHSRHPSGSRYYLDLYKYRSKLFRPKTRAMIRATEAAAANAFFSTADVADIRPEDDSQPIQQEAASLYKALLNYRCRSSDNGIPWFLTCLAGLQEASVYGVVCSFQSWKYRTRKKIENVQQVDPLTNAPMVDEAGNPVMKQEVSEDVIEDKPDIELIPIENIRISPAADWRDPVNSSPYLIHLMPMYVIDVLSMVKNGKSTLPWRPISTQQLQSGVKQTGDSTRRAREGTGSDSKDAEHGSISDYDIVWVHRNIFRRDDHDWLFYTVGTEHLLSDPVPLEKVFLHAARRRPYVLGYGVIEPHRPMPSATAQLVQDLQGAANDIANQRIDNVRLAMNKQFVVREGKSVDLTALQRSVPGGILFSQNPKEDVHVIETKDVTASSYQEQDRINVDFDELAGQFSTGSVQSNRSLNETVGGMQIMASGAGQITEYLIRTFTETWVEPVLRQVVDMLRFYETDENIIAVAAQQAQIKTAIDDALFAQPFLLNVSAAMGATQPNQKVERFMMGMNAVAPFMQMSGVAPNTEEIIKEVFGALGYRDGRRFFMAAPTMSTVDPAVQQEQAKADQQERKMVMDQQIKETQSQQKNKFDQGKLAMEREIALAKLAMEYGVTLNDLEAMLGINAQIPTQLTPMN